MIGEVMVVGKKIVLFWQNKDGKVLEWSLLQAQQINT
jgi:hypothetical protein